MIAVWLHPNYIARFFQNRKQWQANESSTFFPQYNKAVNQLDLQTFASAVYICSNGVTEI